MTENELSYKIRGAIFRTYNKMGPGLFENVYQKALLFELIKDGLDVKSEVPVPMIYEEVHLDIGYRMDLLVNNKVVIEIKSIESISEVHHKQLLTYLKLAGLKLGILVNFNCSDIEKSIIRKVNNL